VRPAQKTLRLRDVHVNTTKVLGLLHDTFLEAEPEATGMDLYEQVVQMHLTVFERLAVIPQFPVLFDDKDEPWVEGCKVAWSAYPDFLALCLLGKREAQVIEVSKARQSAKARELVEAMCANREKMERYIRWFVGDDFEISWRFFVREANKDTLVRQLQAKGIPPKVTALEELFDKLKRVMP